MTVEPYTVAAFIVSTASIVTAGAATFGARYVREAKQNSERAVRLLVGEDDVEGDGLINDVDEHRRALLEADLYPPRRADGGRDDV